MEVYIEYAFLQNFFFDGTLLFLALKTARVKIAWKKLLLSATLGSLFALLYPFIRSPKAVLTLLKISVGVLLCLIPSELKTRKQRGRCVSTLLFYFLFTFSFGGALLAITQTPVWVLLGFLLLTCFSILLVEKLHQKARISAFSYTCKIIRGEISLLAEGFLDSGNCARKNGLPVCFLSPKIFYSLLGEEIYNMGQVRDEMQIRTVSGEKTIPLYIGEIVVNREGEEWKKRVYFALYRNNISLDYDVLLNARIFD